MSKPRDWAWLCLVVLALLPLVFYWRILTPNALDRGAFPAGDFAEQFYAFARFAYDELAQGRLPLWNPYTYAGHPFLADVQSAVFYPPSLIVMAAASLLGGFSLYALEWQAVLHFSLSGIFTFLFARHEFGRLGRPQLRKYTRSGRAPELRAKTGIAPTTESEGDRIRGRPRGITPTAAGTQRNRVNLAACLSAIVFTFGGYLTAYPSQQLAVLETDVWLPLILLGLSISFDGAWLVPMLFSGGALGVALLAGHPQSALYLLVVSVSYALVVGRMRAKDSSQLGRHGRSTSDDSPVRPHPSTGSGCLVSFFRDVPAMSWPGLGVRLAALPAIALGLSAIQWLPSLEFMQLSSRSALTYADYARGFELQDPLQILLPGSVSTYSPLYVGIVPLALMLLALWLPRRPPRMVLFWLGIALFALMLSFGGNVFLYPLLYLFAPGFALFRQQERAAFIFSFALALLAGYGALTLAQPLLPDARRRLSAFARLNGGVLAGAAVLFVVSYFAWSIGSLRGDNPFHDVSTRAAWLMLMLGVWAALLWARRRGALRHALFGAALLLASGLDLFSVNWHTNFQASPPEAQTRAPEFLAPVLADGGLFRTYNEFRIFGNFGDTFHIEDASGASPLRLARYDQFYKLPMERIWSLLNVKYVITWRKSLAEMGVQSEIVATQKISESESTYVHRLQKVAPRAAVVARVDSVASLDEAFARLSAPDFDFTRAAVLDGQALALPPDGGGTAKLVSRTPGSSVWNATASGDSLFVLSENTYPGWHVYVGANEAPLLRVNAIMLGVRIPAGASTVSFVFDPLSVKLGSLISGLTLLGVIAGSLVARRGRSQN